MEAEPETFTHHFDHAIARLEMLRYRPKALTTYDLRQQVQTTMRDHAPVFREGAALAEGMKKLDALQRTPHGVRTQELPWNVELIHALETENLLAQARATMRAALERTESRGAHARADYPARDDAHWLRHSLVWAEEHGQLRYGSRKVALLSGEDTPSFAPEERVY